SAPYRSVANQSSLSVTDTFSSGTFYYFVHAVQADGNEVWSAPMWITFGAARCNDQTPPTLSISSPAAGASLACSDTLVEVSVSDASGVASVQVQVDGGAWSTAQRNAASGLYEFNWASSSAASGSHTLAARATDASCGANVATTAPRSVSVNN